MLTGTEYARQSIELNLFFLRIMKEHLLNVIVTMMLKEPGTIQILVNMIYKYEKLLTNTILLANGVVGPQALAAGDIITQYTYESELVTQNYIGRPINTEITKMEAALVNSISYTINPMIEQSVNILNQQIIGLLEYAIQTQKAILDSVLTCKKFFMTFPMLLNHITNETEHYQLQLHALQQRQSLTDESKRAAMDEIFWNHKMAEHARIGFGFLDPTEELFMQEANRLAAEFDELTRAAGEAYERPEFLPEVTRRSMVATISIRSWKEQILIGTLECKTRSIMAPLLVEHVFREANHYLKVLQAIDLGQAYPQK